MRCLHVVLSISVDKPVVYGLGLAVKVQEKTSFPLNSN